MNEAETRAEPIDPALKAANRGMAPASLVALKQVARAKPSPAT